MNYLNFQSNESGWTYENVAHKMKHQFSVPNSDSVNYDFHQRLDLEYPERFESFWKYWRFLTFQDIFPRR